MSAVVYNFFVISGRCLSTVVLTLVCIFLTSSCHSMTRTVAERCVLVDVHREEDQELIPWLDAFASEHRLMPEKSHPLAARYQLFVAQRLVAEIDYTVGMGAHGAVLTLFRYDETLNEGLPAAFDAFVQKEIAPRYKVTQCADVPDFQTPETYR